MNPRRLFIASCVALIASAFSFSIRGNILPALGLTFGLSEQMLGEIAGAAFLGMAVSMLFGSPVCDYLGMKTMLGLAFLSHLLGSALLIGAPYIVPAGTEGHAYSLHSAYWVLWLSMFLVGCANGFVEVGINPLAATLYPDKKTHILNVLHAWWPGGLVMGGLLSVALTNALGLGSHGEAIEGSRVTTMLGWQIKASLVIIPTLIYGFLFLIEKLPVTERVASGVTNREMYMQAFRPMFLIWAVCMLMTASSELGPQQWQESVLTRTAGFSGTLVLVYTSSLMFVMRHFAGPLAHKFSPVGMLTGSAILTAIGLYSLSFANNTVTALGAATIFGLGISYFWPTMLGVTAERFARGGAFLLGLMGCVGNLAIAAILPIMGGIYDAQTLNALPADVRTTVTASNGKVDVPKLEALPVDVKDPAKMEGARWSFRYVSAVPMVLIFVFGAIALYDKARGGYKPEELPKSKELTPAELASDY